MEVPAFNPNQSLVDFNFPLLVRDEAERRSKKLNKERALVWNRLVEIDKELAMYEQLLEAV